MDKNNSKEEELLRFRAEAQELLGIKEPPPELPKEAAGVKAPAESRDSLGGNGGRP